MPISRRTLLGSAAGFIVVPVTSNARARNPRPTNRSHISATAFCIRPGSGRDQTKQLQTAIDAAARHKLPLLLPPGRIISRQLQLRSSSIIEGASPQSQISLVGDNARLTAAKARDITLKNLRIDGSLTRLTGDRAGLLVLRQIKTIDLEGLTILNSPASAVVLEECGGSVRGCTISGPADAAIFSIDATGLSVTRNTITSCANNGILIWRNRIGEDRTLVANNRISHIRARAGGSGQNGNGVNIFRAGNVIVSANHITDCAYSAVRSNSSSNVQMLGNNCIRIGEVALYAEFAFNGAIIANNLVDQSATGISVTNFNEGGRDLPPTSGPRILRTRPHTFARFMQCEQGLAAREPHIAGAHLAAV